jgi:hypothetical protein
MKAEIAADPRYSPAHFIAPSPSGYVHIGGNVAVPSRPGPVLRRGADKLRLESRLKGLARQLMQNDAVRMATVYDAVVMPPFERLPNIKERAASVELPRYDIVVLIEAVDPTAIPGVQATGEYQSIIDELHSGAKHIRVTAARNAKRIADVDRTRQGTFIFNHFVADDPEIMLELFDYLAGWYEAETGVDNSTLLVPLEGEKWDWVAINHARWDASVARVSLQQFSKRTFRSYVVENLKRNRVGAMPVLYRLA